MSDHVIVMTRLPVPGQTKTRLEPLLGPRGCAALHRACLRDLKETLERLACRQPVSIHVCYDGRNPQTLECLVPGGARLCRQRGKSLGTRMQDVLARTGQPGNRMILIGSDSPQIRPEDLVRGFALLEKADLVFGPALDGGYYLVGTRSPAPALLAEPVDRGGAEVLSRTLALAGRQGLSTALLRPLRDLDEPEDLHAFRQEQGRPSPESGPVWTLRELDRLLPKSSGKHRRKDETDDR